MKLIIRTFILLIVSFSCTSHLPEKEPTQSEEIELNNKSRDDNKDSIQYILKERISYWEAKIPELDINYDKLLKSMISDVLNHVKGIDSERNYLIIAMENSSSLGQKQSSTMELEVRVMSYNSNDDKIISKDDFVGYFYTSDSMLVLSKKLPNSIKLPFQENDSFKLFTFSDKYIADEPNVIYDPIYIPYIIKNDSLFRVESFMQYGHESKELVAHRALPKFYK